TILKNISAARRGTSGNPSPGRAAPPASSSSVCAYTAVAVLRDLSRSRIRPFIIRQAAVSITPGGWRAVNDAARQPPGGSAAAFARAGRIPGNYRRSSAERRRLKRLRDFPDWSTRRMYEAPYRLPTTLVLHRAGCDFG